ncbi:MAG TPA: flagellar basal body L-ring protein FlgH [Bryobacteraceae bacterium]
MKTFCLTLVLCGAAFAAKKPDKNEHKQISPLDKYIQEASVPQASNGQVAEKGSLWSPAAQLADLASDHRARHIDDIVTIVVQESASAVSTGATKTSRSSAATANITSLAGKKSATGALANLAGLNGSNSLDGQGTTSRQTQLTTTISARVTHVLVNGNLVIEGTKNLTVNAENQVIILRGVIRPIDMDTTNTITSDRVGQMELQVNGKGIVNDAVRRPNILYRMLLGILPF